MKSIKDLRENYNLITEKEEHDMNKLTQLVRAGLFDAKKLSALKRAMEKPADKMTAQEKRMMINLLDSLMAEVLSDKQVYRKIKQDVMKEAHEIKDYYSGPDPRVQRVGYPSNKTEAPSVLLLKRKAIRVFPDGQKVALYYAQSIDKYVSIPYNEIGINEELELDENALTAIGGAVLKYGAKYADDAVKLGGKALSKGKNLASKAFNKWKSARAAKNAKNAKTPKKPSSGLKKIAGGAAAGAAVADAVSNSSSSGSGSSGSSEPKYFTPMSSKIQANISGPKREGGADARSERERQASLRATRAQANESVNLDGNIFELNTITAIKISALYESLNRKNKKKMVELMKESDESFNKIVSFAVRQ